MCVCVGRRSLRDFESFGAEGEVKEIQGERPPIGMLMPKTSPTWAPNPPALSLVFCVCGVIWLSFFFGSYVSSSTRDNKREEGKKKLCVRDLYRTHLSPSKLLLGRSYLSALVVKESLSLETFFGGGFLHTWLCLVSVFFFFGWAEFGVCGGYLNQCRTAAQVLSARSIRYCWRNRKCNHREGTVVIRDVICVGCNVKREEHDKSVGLLWDGHLVYQYWRWVWKVPHKKRGEWKYPPLTSYEWPEINVWWVRTVFFFFVQEDVLVVLGRLFASSCV